MEKDNPKETVPLLQAFSETTASFCKQSSLHGFKNVITDIEEIESSLSKTHKLIKSFSLMVWIGVCMLSLIFAVVLMLLVYNRYRTTPTITTIETNNFPIWNVNFPAVTICDINKVHRSAAEPIIHKLVNLGLQLDKVEAFFENLSKLMVPEYIDEAHVRILETLDIMNYTTERLMFEVMRPCRDMIHNCSWLGSTMPCDHLFKVATSTEGFCCSFNYIPPLDPKLILTETDYIEDTASSNYRASGAGPSVGLEALIDVSKINYYSYIQTYYGVSVYVHKFDAFPQPADKALIAQPGTDAQIAVMPSVLVSSSNIRSLPLTLRNCFFDDEKKLRTASKYTYQSCISECAVDTILKMCKCLPFFYPEVHLRRLAGGFVQCTLQDVNCLRKNRKIFNSLQPDGANETLGLKCDNCLPSCSEELYNVQAITSIRNENDTLKTVTNYGGVNMMENIQLRVHFKDITCIKYRRDIFMTWDTMLAALGGIFGLCLGGSVISLIEFLYYFTFKLFNNVGHRRGNMIAVQPICRNEVTDVGSRGTVNYSRRLRGNGNNISRRTRNRKVPFSVAHQLFATYEQKYSHFRK